MSLVGFGPLFNGEYGVDCYRGRIVSREFSFLDLGWFGSVHPYPSIPQCLSARGSEFWSQLQQFFSNRLFQLLNNLGALLTFLQSKKQLTNQSSFSVRGSRGEPIHLTRQQPPATAARCNIRVRYFVKLTQMTIWIYHEVFFNLYCVQIAVQIVSKRQSRAGCVAKQVVELIRGRRRKHTLETRPVRSCPTAYG